MRRRAVVEVWQALAHGKLVSFASAHQQNALFLAVPALPLFPTYLCIHVVAITPGCLLQGKGAQLSTALLSSPHLFKQAGASLQLLCC
jgi:hypothetical protein